MCPYLVYIYKNMKFVTNPKFRDEDIIQLNKNQMRNHFSVVVENIDNIASGKVYNI